METAAARIAGIFFQMFKDMGTFQSDPRVQLGSPLLADTGAAAARCAGGQKAFLNQEDVRDMVLDSYQDMQDGKGRDYKEFFSELESRYHISDV